MPQRKFVNQKALVDYAERNGLVYLWAGPERRTSPMPTFTKRQSSLDGDLGVVRDKKTRHAANRCKGARVSANPIGKRLRPGRLDIGEV
jgi:hypothetical protein